ncbi:MAG TPA: PAS domain S-box protein, partial [Candidatus Binatia bacterium]
MTRSVDAPTLITGENTTIKSELQPGDHDLHNNEDRFSALFENSIDAVLLIDAQGTIEAANPEACQLFDRTEKEMIQLDWTELMDSTDSRMHILLTDQERSGRSRGELGFRRKDASVFLGEVSAASYRNKTGLLKASVIIRDITERRRV